MVIYGNEVGFECIDKSLSNWVAETIGYKNKILVRNRVNRKTIYRIKFQSKEVFNIFVSYGITPKKSNTIKFPSYLSNEELPDFIRGEFDGDGSIFFVKNYGRIEFTTGSFDFAKGLKECLTRILGSTVILRPRISTTSQWFAVCMNRQAEIIKFGEWIYKDASFALERKREKFRLLGALV